MKMMNNSFTIGVCDDEEQDIEYIRREVNEIMNKENIKNEIYSYNSGYELIEDMKNGRKFDLLLLDVLMPEINGMELASYLRDNEYEDSIVFISVNREMAMRGYEVSAARYLEKPIDTERLREALLYCFKHKQKSEIIIPVKGGMQRVSEREIIYIETQGRGSKIILENSEIYTKLLISQLEKELLKQNFVRCHQGFIVNLRYVRNLKSKTVVLTGEISLPVSKYRSKQVQKAFMSYLDE